MYYGKKTINELDQYYGININNYKEFPHWMKSDCEKIQRAFKLQGIQLTLAECRELYTTYSDEGFSSGWNASIDSFNEEILFKILYPWLINIIQDRIYRICSLSKELEESGFIENQDNAEEKYLKALIQIDTHIRSSKKPIPYIIETLKSILPEYQK
ncbi:hypothetical protein [Clostridium cochlearium]|uniref:hypothetical protein n=1 Tax=Clostridium cochlearium TaxID=1494 RepID=UPI001820363E|nr:hypothetical protein [Clostridium cochlearium]NMA58233.1 hypothetical protein [Clostridium cochlearium]